jgi:hypothetical protein
MFLAQTQITKRLQEELSNDIEIILELTLINLFSRIFWDQSKHFLRKVWDVWLWKYWRPATHSIFLQMNISISVRKFTGAAATLTLGNLDLQRREKWRCVKTKLPISQQTRRSRTYYMMEQSAQQGQRRYYIWYELLYRLSFPHVRTSLTEVRKPSFNFKPRTTYYTCIHPFLQSFTCLSRQTWSLTAVSSRTYVRPR